MNLPVSKDVNNSNLIFVSNLLQDIRYVAFYGTLLGLIRDGSTIAGDDDIDIVIHNLDRTRLMSLLSDAKQKYAGHQFEITVYSDRFVQVATESEYGRGLIDFYICKSKNSDLYDEWSFWGLSANRFFSVKFPLAWLDEVRQIDLLGSFINVPKDYHAALQFLYGSDWKRPRVKGKEYVLIPWCHRPITLVRPFVIFGRIYNKFLSYLG